MSKPLTREELRELIASLPPREEGVADPDDPKRVETVNPEIRAFIAERARLHREKVSARNAERVAARRRREG